MIELIEIQFKGDKNNRKSIIQTVKESGYPIRKLTAAGNGVQYSTIDGTHQLKKTCTFRLMGGFCVTIMTHDVPYLTEKVLARI